jgi:hypothetical protein
MNAYMRRQAEQRERQRAYMVRRQTEARAQKMEHANAVMCRYEAAWRECCPDIALPSLTFDAKTGYYYTNGNAVREDTLAAHATWMFVKAHERDMNTSDA